MIRAGRLLLLLVFIVVVQTAVLPYFRVAGAVPDLGLVATVAIAYREGPELGAGFGFAAGLGTDLFLETPLGLTALAWAITGYLVGVLQGGLVRTSWWIVPLLGALGGLVGGALYLGIGALIGQEQLWSLGSLRTLLVAAAYDGVIALVVFPLAGYAARGPAPRAGAGSPPRW